MSHITIGKSEGKNVGFDIEVFLRTHLLIWASTGGGKSYLIRRLVEQMFGKIPIIIVDREGEFPTLREKYGFVLVGPGGETPADPRSAKLVAEKLLELRASAVCDLFEMKTEGRHEWVKNFFEALVNAPKRLWGPTAVILDEAHTFCPEKGQGESPAYGAVADFNGVARKRGFGSIFATQRLSKLSKNATAEMYNQAAGPTARQADRDRAAYEMGISGRAEIKEFSDVLRTLEPGNFFFQGRAISMDRILVQVGEVETTHAGAGSGKYTAKAPPTPDKIKALLPKLADLPQLAEEKAKTETELRSEIRSLKAQLRSQPTVAREVKVADPIAIDRAVNVATAELRKGIAERDHFIARLRGMIGKASNDIAALTNLSTPAVIAATTRTVHAPRQIAQAVSVSKSPILPRASASAEQGSEGSDETLPVGEKTILIAVAQYPEGVERDQLSVLSGYKKSSRDVYLARLKQRGFLDDRRGKMFATDSGISTLGSSYETLPRGADLQRYWLEKLPEGEKRILEYLLSGGGNPVDRDAIDEATGYKKSSRDVYLSRLVARRVVEQAGRGQVKVADILFD